MELVKVAFSKCFRERGRDRHIGQRKEALGTHMNMSGEKGFYKE